jgi:hypothetical protein
MASIGMEGLQEFMVFPDNLDDILERLESRASAHLLIDPEGGVHPPYGQRTECTRPSTWLQRNKMVVTPILFLLPGLLFFGLYVIIPIFQSFNISLYRWDGLGEATYIGLANYEELLTDRNFEISLWNNAKWLALYLLAIPLGLASRCSSTRRLPASVSTNRCSFSLSCSARWSWASCSRGSTCRARGF